MKFDTSIVIATLAASVIAAPAPYAGVVRRYVVSYSLFGVLGLDWNHSY
jgi:hypothetical protein